MGVDRGLAIVFVKTRVKSIVKLKSMLMIIGFAAAFAAPSMAKDAIATGARVEGDAQHTRFEVDFSKAVGFSVYVLTEPYRVVIDLSGVNFDLPPGVGREATGLITSYRYGMVDEGKSRIMLDTAGPVLIAKSYALPAKGKKPARIVVELVESSQDAFDEAYAKDHPEVQTATITPVDVQPKSEAPSNDLKTIVIDPGHGGIDPGASSHRKTREKDVVLAYGLELRDALEKTGHYRVVMTRNDDTFVSLQGRVKIARDNKADLFIAIHADTVTGEGARGTTIYTVSDKATDAEAEALAQKENRADIIAGMDLGNANKDVADILINLAQRESKNEAMYFSKKAVTELKQVTEMTGKPIRSAAFVVLKAPDVPSVLVELGYLSSKKDEALLVSPEWRARMAQALTNAVENYFAPNANVTQN
jgi:N-acetylmuramoyl-L-alanine amidase